MKGYYNAPELNAETFTEDGGRQTKPKSPAGHARGITIYYTSLLQLCCHG